MALDEYNAAETRDPYYPDTDSTRANARLWSIEKLALDLAAAGFVTLFKGAGTNPTTLAGYATSKLWLNSAAGVTDAPGVVRGYDGSGDATLVTSWPVLDLAGLRRHLSVYSRTETDALIASGLPPGFGSDDIANDSAVAGATVSDALETLDTAVGTKVAASALGVSVATLDGGGKLTTSQIPAILTSPFQFQGTWNAATNSPALASGVGTAGHLYRVSVSGTTALDGEASWAAGDELYFGGGVWNKLGASSGSTTIMLPTSAQDARITILGQTNGGGSAKYQMAGTADGRVLIWGDTAAFGFNAVGDRYFAYDLERPWDTALYRPTAIYCAHTYAIVLTDEPTGNAYFIGDSTHGQGGQGSTTAVTRLTRIAQFVTDAVKIASVVTNGNRNTTEGFWFALTTAGTAYGCGYSGAQHVMGYGNTAHLSSPRKLTLSDGTTVITDIDAITCDTAYTPVWLHLASNKVLRHGAGTDGAHGNNSTTALQWPTYLETAVGSGIHRTDVAQVVTTGNGSRAVSWLRTTAGKIESSGSRYYGNGDGAALLSAASNTFQPATGGIAALTVSKLVCGGGEYYDCVAITSTGTGYLCGYIASYGLLGNGSVANLNTFTLLAGLPSGFSGALTNAVIAGGAAYTAIYIEATIAGMKSLAAIGYDVYYNTGKGTASVAAASQTWGLVRGVVGTVAAWSVFGTHQEYGIAVLSSDAEARYAGPSDQGQGGVSSGQTTAIDILQPVRTGLPRLLKGLTSRGAYAAGTEYSFNDTVRDQGSAWRYTHGTPTTGNAPPTLPTESNSYWELLAKKGDAGPANTLAIGTVTTGAAGTSAAATITGTAPSQVLNLTIPRGDTGGDSTVPGPAGASPIATSASSVTVGPGERVFTTQAGCAFLPYASRIRAATTDGTKAVEGVCTFYSGTTLKISSDHEIGSGIGTYWNIAVIGERGGGADPGGPDGAIQFKSGAAISGSSKLKWSLTDEVLDFTPSGGRVWRIPQGTNAQDQPEINFFMGDYGWTNGPVGTPNYGDRIFGYGANVTNPNAVIDPRYSAYWHSTEHRFYLGNVWAHEDHMSSLPPGSGAQLSLRFSSDATLSLTFSGGGLAAVAGIVDGGYGFEVGDSHTLSGGTGAVVVVMSVDANGTITSAGIAVTGSGYTNGTRNTAFAAFGRIAAVLSVVAGGQNYLAGTVIPVSGGTGGAVRVTSVDGSGAITAATLYRGGSAYANGTATKNIVPGEHRWFSIFAPHSGGVGSIISSCAHKWSFYDTAGTERVQFDWTNAIGTVTLAAATRLWADVNNMPLAVQRNASGLGTVNLPYVGTLDQLIVSAPIQGGGPHANYGGAYTWLSIIPADAYNGATAIAVQAPSVTGIYSVFWGSATATGSVRNYIRNYNATGGTAMFRAEANGGDVGLQLGASFDVATWTLGLDNSVSGDPLVISRGDTLGANNAFTIDSDGMVGFGTYTATPLTIVGYITIKDIGGTSRKLAVVS